MPTRNRHIGRTLDEFIAEQKARSPEFAAAFDAELARRRVARTIRAAREQAGVSQAELAERVGTNQPSIARVESGKVTPKIDFLDRIARALGMHLEVRLVPEEPAQG
ncbi:helix-turn-helix transcriptional regulator [Myxococcota bacterium]|nr:helix-turn-helix transcriptional regulator [Myxococcota bacterium]